MNKSSPNAEKRYALVRSIGKGKYSTVYKAIDSKNDETVAIKFVSNDVMESNPYAKANLEEEVKVLLAIDHPNVVKLKDYFENSKGIYVVMEYCEGGTLTELVEKEKGLGEDRAVSLFVQILQAYRCLLSQSIVHRDIKPDNILIRGDKAVLADFGFSKILQPYEVTYSIAGTPITTAPEVMSNNDKGYSSKCDIWSLGCVFYYMIFGEYHARVRTMSDLVIFNQEKTGQNMQFPGGKELSYYPSELIKKMIEPNSGKRISWKQLYAHPLLADNESIEGISNRVVFHSNFRLKTSENDKTSNTKSDLTCSYQKPTAWMVLMEEDSQSPILPTQSTNTPNFGPSGSVTVSKISTKIGPSKPNPTPTLARIIPPDDFPTEK